MQRIKFNNLKMLFILLAAVLLLSACTEKSAFTKGDIKDDFCGAYINFQYCKCAFHNEYCDAIGMKKREADKYVKEQYEKWVDSELAEFKQNCAADNGYSKGENCFKCKADEIAKEGGCVARNGANSEADEADDEAENQPADEEGASAETAVCKYDSDCEPLCEGAILWKMGCNPRENICEKTFDTDCAADIENFGGQAFPKICAQGACVRDAENIEKTKANLLQTKQTWSDAVKDINSARADINIAMLDANKNCINGIADMTNVAIMEFSTRIASVLAGGIPDIAAMTASAAEKAGGLAMEHVKNLAGAAADYAGEALNRLYNYQSGEPAQETEKLKPHEYIKLNCDLYEYFKNVLAASDADLDTALTNAKQADELYKALP